LRIGTGYDLHPLRDGRKLVIGGVHIEHPKGLEGHSDADVLTHAVIDAMLGAAGLGDIGAHFPRDDARYKGVSSLSLLAEASRVVSNAGYRVVNVDSTVIAQAPRLQHHLAEMARNIAHALGLEQGAVSVKATSPEGIGSLGAGEGIAAQAVALVDK
jgi:2-C-methyl-D-erythritol 2,4-cyclodiphosphate synthase